MDDIQKILSNIALPGTSNRTPEEQAAEVEVLDRMAHKRHCAHCSGEVPELPCTDTPDYAEVSGRRWAGLPMRHPKTFDNFEHRDELTQAFTAAREMANNPEGILVIYGWIGVGKTHLCQAVVNHRLSLGLPGRLYNVAMMLDQWRSWYTQDDMGFDELFLRRCRAPFVVLDDLGAEKVTQWTVEKLTAFIDFRYENDYPTVITTNDGRTQLVRKYGDGRIADRIFDQRNNLVLVETTSFRTDVAS